MGVETALLCSLLITMAMKSESSIKVSDILNVEYLPSTLLLEEAVIEKETREAEDSLANITSDGDIKEAYLTMQYHRSKMNEYMCRVYVADEILSELGENQIGRVGMPASNHRTSNRDHLLNDLGSSSYKDWLSRSTLLDDVYRHYDTIMEGSDDIETGEVTGYAVQGGGKTTASGPTFSSTGGYHDHGSSFGPPTHNFNPHQGYHDHGSSYGHPPHSFHPHQGGDEYYIHHDYESGSKSLAVKDLFDLALTALAFLAFGVFIMNLIMTCMLGNQGTTVLMQTTTATATDSDDGDSTTSDEDESSESGESDDESPGEAAKTRRRRRSAEDELNQMAYRVSKSVETFLGLERRKNCLRYTLCKDNRYSRRLDNHKRIWLPLWSFGMSWVSGHFGEDRLANLRGAVLGLGAANCEEVYPQCQR